MAKYSLRRPSKPRPITTPVVPTAVEEELPSPKTPEPPREYMVICGVEIIDQTMLPGWKYPMQPEFKRRGIPMSARQYDEEVKRLKGITSVTDDKAIKSKPLGTLVP